MRSAGMIGTAFFVACLWLSPQAAHSEQANGQPGANRVKPALQIAGEVPERLVVMIHGRLGESDIAGAGVVFGFYEDRLYIVTSAHLLMQSREGMSSLQVATDVRVTFRDLPEKRFPAVHLASNFERDWAILAVAPAREAGIRTCRLPLGILSAPGLPPKKHHPNFRALVVPVGNVRSNVLQHLS